MKKLTEARPRSTTRPSTDIFIVVKCQLRGSISQVSIARIRSYSEPIQKVVIFLAFIYLDDSPSSIYHILSHLKAIASCESRRFCERSERFCWWCVCAPLDLPREHTKHPCHSAWLCCRLASRSCSQHTVQQ